MQFKKQTVAGENILIKINSSEIDGSQFSLLYTFVIEGTAELVGLGRQTYKIFDLKSQPLLQVPSDIRNLLGPIHVDEEHLLYKY